MFIQISSQLVSPGTLLSAIALSCEPNASWISVLTGPLPSPTKPILLLIPIGGQSIGLPCHMAKLLGTVLDPPFPSLTQPANPSCLQIPAGSPLCPSPSPGSSPSSGLLVLSCLDLPPRPASWPASPSQLILRLVSRGPHCTRDGPASCCSQPLSNAGLEDILSLSHYASTPSFPRSMLGSSLYYLYTGCPLSL